MIEWDTNECRDDIEMQILTTYEETYFMHYSSYLFEYHGILLCADSLEIRRGFSM
jgi:hypothetical protein